MLMVVKSSPRRCETFLLFHAAVGILCLALTAPFALGKSENDPVVESIPKAIDVFLDISIAYNGVYDIVCFVFILAYPAHGLAKLHSNVFTKVELSAFSRRILAYWVFTYAMPRLLAGVWRSRWLDGLAAFTYFVEGICYHVEQKKYKSTLMI